MFLSFSRRTNPRNCFSCSEDRYALVLHDAEQVIVTRDHPICVCGLCRAKNHIVVWISRDSRYAIRPYYVVSAR